MALCPPADISAEGTFKYILIRVTGPLGQEELIVRGAAAALPLALAAVAALIPGAPVFAAALLLAAAYS